MMDSYGGMNESGEKSKNEHLFMRLKEFDRFYLEKDLLINQIK